MGEAADDLIDGLVCSWCGTWFVESHGHPVLCGACWHEASEDERKEIPKARHDVI